MVLFTVFVFSDCVWGQMPEGFSVEVVNEDILHPAGIVYPNDSMHYVYTLDGKIWAFVNGVKQDIPLLDISDEVAMWWDHGMIGTTIDPDFQQNGYIYLAYVVDRHHLNFYGTEDYDPEANNYYSPTIGRVVRYQVNTDDFLEAIPESRHILIGEAREDGLPINTFSHAVGSLVFGKDGTLFLGMGDSSAPSSGYTGEGPPPDGSYDDQSLEEGIIEPEEHVGAYRAQYLNSYCGKILRMNPEDGSGIPGNPYFDPENPDSPKSKVWALGFRNPFRMALMPNTGSSDPEANDPGALIVGDVGDWTWEEINIVDDPGKNFGWPIYQGLDSYYLFDSEETRNMGAPIANPCNEYDYYRFIDLITQPKQDHNEVFPHPCGGGQINPDETVLHVMERPFLSYSNYSDGVPVESLLPYFDENGNSVGLSISNPDTGVEGGHDFSGIASVAGNFYTGDAFPLEYQGAYFHADHEGWLKVFHIQQGALLKVEHWLDSIGNMVHLSMNPQDDCLYLTTVFPGSIKKICFEGDQKPVVVMTPDTTYGSSPLNVAFDASESYDPEGGPLTFLWNFGDGETSTDTSPVHTFESEDPVARIVELTVTDSSGNFSTGTALVSLNNTPPQVDISSVEDSALYPMDQTSFWNLMADLTDLESPTSDLQFEWHVYLHHNTHFHLLSNDNSEASDAQLQPLGCEEEETYYYRFSLLVTDPWGLQGSDQVIVFPDCDGQLGNNAEDRVVEELLIAPNPGSNVRTLMFPTVSSGEMTISVYSTSGMVSYEAIVQIEDDQKSMIWQFPELAVGHYIVRFSHADWTAVRKMVVSN